MGNISHMTYFVSSGCKPSLNQSSTSLQLKIQWYLVYTRTHQQIT